MMNQRPAIAAMLAFSSLLGAPAAALPPPVREETPYLPIFCEPRALAAGFGAFDAVHHAQRGDLLVAPRDYAAGLVAPDTRDPDSDRIYDIAFLGLDGDGILLEVRGYSGADLKRPKVSRTLSFPRDTKTIRLRHLIIDVGTVSDLAVTYRVAIGPPAVEPAVDDSASPTEAIAPDHCGRDRRDIVEPVAR